MAENGYFIRELPAAPAFAVNQAFAVEDDVGPDSYHVTGAQMLAYFDVRYQPAGNYLESVIQDTAPQLGGNLDVNGNAIVSAANGPIAITPNGTGSIVLDGLNWPQADGTNEQVLSTNGAGQLYFRTVSGGGGGDYVAWNPTTGLATNIAVGSRILIGDATTGAAITATDSILIGQAAGQDLTSATGCVAVGTSAMAENVTGARNAVFGHQAGRGAAGNSYSDCTLVGYQSGLNLTTGGNNVCIGTSAGQKFTTASSMVVIGREAARDMTTQNTCVMIGLDVGKFSTGNANVFVGTQAGRFCSGSANFFMGANTGENCSGNSNVGIGEQVLKSVGNGGGSVGIGASALHRQTSGVDCVGIGQGAGYNNASGSRNTSIGDFAGYGVNGNSYSDNTFVGYQSGFLITTGGINCFFGSESGKVFTSGSGNVCLGNEVGKSAVGATLSNLLMIDNSDTARPLVSGDFSGNNFGINFNIGTDSYGASSNGIFFIGNATAVPTGNPSGGGVLYVEAGALKYRGTSGTVTTLGPA